MSRKEVQLDILKLVVADQKPVFATKDISEDRRMKKAHPHLVRDSLYHTFVGGALSDHHVQLRIDKIGQSGSRGARWEKRALAQPASSAGPHSAPRPEVLTPAAGTGGDIDEGAIFSRGNGFRARAEAHQRRFRMENLRVGCARYGHHLDEQAANTGANFLHPAAWAVAQERSRAGKGVHAGRTFGNMLSSQAMCFNVFGPLCHGPGGLGLAGAMLAPFVPGLDSVSGIDIEYTPSGEVFGDQSGMGGVDCDVLIGFSDGSGRRGVLVIETKFVEDSFSCCGHCKPKAGDPCPVDVRIGADFQGCRYARRNRYRYWDRTAETKSLRLPLHRETGCPFRGPLWQVWVNHTLAHVEAASRGASHGVFAVCAPVDNEPLKARAVLEEFRDLVTDPSTVAFIPLEQLLSRLHQAAGRQGAPWGTWADLLQKRYSVPPTSPEADGRATPA